MKIRENHRVVVMGSGGVGKTSLVTQFMQGSFSTTYKPTIEDYYRHTIQLPDGAIHTVEILDTSGTHYFPAMRELSIRSGRAFILVFSLDNLQSFHEVVTLWDDVKRIRGNSSVPLVLVGNKSDLERKVTIEHVIQSKAELMNDCPYIETSAMLNRNVVKLFLELLQQANKISNGGGTGSGGNSSSSSYLNSSGLRSGGNGSNTGGNATPELKRRKLSRRLSSFGSLPNISLIRRKSSTNSSTKSNSSQKSIDSANGDTNGTSSSGGKIKAATNSQLANYNNGIKSGNPSTSSSSSSAHHSNHHYFAKKSASVDTPGPSSSSSSSFKGKGKGTTGVEQLIANNINNINEFVDDGMIGLKRVLINGIDTISLTDGTQHQRVDPNCAIL